MSSEHTAFSASGEDVITRVIDVQTEEVPFNDELFDEFYEITRTAEEIIKGDYKRIALQFPDELLHDSVPIFRRLKPILGAGRDLYVLADTSYGRQALPSLDVDLLSDITPEAAVSTRLLHNMLTPMRWCITDMRA